MKYLVKRISSQQLELLEGQYPNQEIFEDILDAPPELEHPLDADILEGVDDMGFPYRYVVLNTTKRDARIAAELAEKQAAEVARQTEDHFRTQLKIRVANYKDEFESLRIQIQNVDINSVTSLATAKTVMADMKQVDAQMGLLLYSVVQDLFSLAERTL